MSAPASAYPWLVKGSGPHYVFMIFLAWVAWAVGYTVGLYGQAPLDWSRALAISLVGAVCLASGVFKFSIKGYVAFVLTLGATGFAWHTLFIAVAKSLG